MFRQLRALSGFNTLKMLRALGEVVTFNFWVKKSFFEVSFSLGEQRFFHNLQHKFQIFSYFQRLPIFSSLRENFGISGKTRKNSLKVLRALGEVVTFNFLAKKTCFEVSFGLGKQQLFQQPSNNFRHLHDFRRWAIFRHLGKFQSLSEKNAKTW